MKMSKLINTITKTLADLTTDKQEAVAEIVNMLAERNDAGSKIKPGQSNRAAVKPVEDEDDVQQPAKKPGRKPGRKPNSEKPEKPAKPANKPASKPAKPATTAAKPAAKMDVSRFGGFSGSKKAISQKTERAMELMADKKSHEFYTKKANKAKLKINLGRGKPSDESRKMAAIVALVENDAI